MGASILLEPFRRVRGALRQRLGMVFQQYNLFPHMSVLANVTAGPLYVLDWPRAEAEKAARELLAKVPGLLED